MSKHWRPGEHVVRGEFGRRGGARSSGWLSPEAYHALSPAEKNALRFERAKQRHQQRFRPAPARYRKGYYARQRLMWMAAVTAVVLAASQIDVALPRFGDPADASAPVRASFGYCWSGGGTNCVVDGDTFWIGGEKVRIADIDAPETHPARCDYEAQLGEQATEKLHALLNSGAVTMTSIDRDRDKYGRLLRNVAVNGADVGEAMVSAGVAREWVGHRKPWC